MSVYSYNAAYSLTDALATTPEISDWGEARYGVVFIPAGSAITTLTFYAAPQPGGTFLPLYDAATVVTLTVQTGRAYQLPPKIQGARAVKIVADHAGTVDISFQEQ